MDEQKLWEKVNKRCGEDVLDISVNAANQNINASQLANKIVKRCEVSVKVFTKDLTQRNAELEEKLRWIPADDPPKMPPWEKYYYALEYESYIPKVMTAAEIWLDEGSEVEFYKPITLPKAAAEARKAGS